MTLFVSVDGGEGAGKTTVATALADRARARGAEVVLTREPGGTPLGVAIRESLFRANERTDEPMGAWAEALLFLADRAEHVARVIRPSLARGAVVICDRFTDSTIAYQAYGRGLDLDLLRQLNRAATGSTTPNLTLLLDVPVSIGLARTRLETFDRIGHETADFHTRVYEGFGRLAIMEPDRIKSIDAAQPIDAVIADAWELVAARLSRIGFPGRT